MPLICQGASRVQVGRGATGPRREREMKHIQMKIRGSDGGGEEVGVHRPET